MEESDRFLILHTRLGILSHACSPALPPGAANNVGVGSLPDSAHQPDLEYYITAICAIDWAISELLLINREGET